jgi:putative hydrolase of the HAD superfamily
MTVRAVIFDFGGVLCFHPTDAQIAGAACACGLPVADFLHAFWANRHAYDAGEIGPDTYWRAVAETAGRAFADDLVAELTQREIDFWSRYDGRVLAWAAQLRSHGLRAGILSNMPQPLGAHLRATRTLLDYFDHITFSYELRVVKPQAAIYEDALRGLAVAPAEALFLDDRPENVEGARAVGLQAELYVSWEQFLQDALGRYGLPVPIAVKSLPPGPAC